MKVTGIIHQQICQLRWHLLACLGLIMVLPVEEAMVSFREGDGFFSDGMPFTAILFGPLLAGLIACANVQGDLDEKRYIFWRSKPANIKFLIGLKFFVGLVASLLVIACPLVFHIISNVIWNKEGLDKTFFQYYAPLPILISIMTYSLCFTCNVLVRKTARAWLIGILSGSFILVLPFILPLNYRDFVSDVMFLTLGLYMAIILIACTAAFVLALYAAKYDWHLKTNLKGLLWVVAGLVFVLLMLFSSQVANIKVLDERKLDAFFGSNILDYAGSKVVYKGHNYVDNKNDLSSLVIESGNVGADIFGNLSIDSTGRRIHYGPKVAGYDEYTYPSSGKLLYKDAGNRLFSFSTLGYYRKEGQGQSSKKFYEKVYLRSYKDTGDSWMPVCELDISDCLKDTINIIRTAMRLIDNRLIICVNDSCIIMDVSAPEELKLIHKQLDVLEPYWPFTSPERKKEFTIPLVQIEEIGLQERIRLSIDLNYRFHYGINNIYESTIVDIDNDKTSFFLIDHEEVARFEVIRWDDEKIYCRFDASRPYTILEIITGPLGPFSPTFVKNGKFYCHNDHTLMVFDVRSKRGIRKLGHFVRMDYDIEDIAVPEDSNILLSIRWHPEFGRNRLKEYKYYLYLLQNPE